jgi:hypothetical protein
VLCAAPMVATTPALHMVQDGSFSVLSGASSAEISRTIRDPTHRETRSRRHVARSNSVVPGTVEAEFSHLPPGGRLEDAGMNVLRATYRADLVRAS